MRTRLGVRRALLGFLAGVGLVAGLIAVVGRQAVATATSVPLSAVVVTVALVACGLLLWGLGLWVVFDAIERPVGVGPSIALSLAGTALNAVTPFGQVGGDPLTAGLIARATRVEYEVGLAAIGATNAVIRLVSVAVGLVGVGVLLLRDGAGAAILPTAGAVVLGITVVLGVALLAWWRRVVLVGLLASALTPVARAVGRVVPRVPVPDRESVRARVDSFVASLERLADAPRHLALVALLGCLGEVAVAGALWIALSAVGAPVPLSLAVVILPIARVAAVLPTPGGTGGVESMLVWLLVVTTDTAAATAAGGVLLYRLVAFWFPLGVGGLAAVGVVVRGAE
ncbi:lysylphosphatidylglycerol synthase domain-containing protein [Salinirubrum litoreum]|uniref:Lysylphosphatidylglycerol synthase domain-containing protein n=1 Tax=Salinirubrum litoreum TaxID=1126234 RepID=A0ABD5R8B3_9EURY|nr:lysylphosphatidylglycerol synthase domain-containing protein [Salinirubrum litoreum]